MGSEEVIDPSQVWSYEHQSARLCGGLSRPGTVRPSVRLISPSSSTPSSMCKSASFKNTLVMAFLPGFEV